MKVSVAYAGPLHQSWIELEAENDATIEQVITCSGFLAKFPEIDLEENKVGVFGKVTPLTTALKDGDRVEIYRRITRVLDEDDDDDDD